MTRVPSSLLRWSAASLVLAAGPALPAPSDVSPSGFTVTLRHETRATPRQLYESLGRVDQWWNERHTYSGKASNLSLPLQAGGCFCERWGQSSVEHARVIYAAENSALRLSGALGPLQALGVQGTLHFAFAEKDGRTTLEVGYRVTGHAGAGLDRLAGPVDSVLAEQTRRLISFAETGKPE